MKYVIIIPSLNADIKLIDLVKELKQNSLEDIIVINDGSQPEYNHIYEEVERLGAKLLVHRENLGKGAGIKTAINSLKNEKDIAGYITVDADGQHKVSDVIKIIESMKEHPESLVLGTRDFSSKNVPFKSKYGNKFSSIYFFLQTGKVCKDTQTGLRGIPFSMTELALKMPGNRYEYEMNFLAQVAINKLNMVYVKIQTIYENNNKVSHFRPFRDSMLIYKDWIKYTFASITSAAIDILIFYILMKVLQFDLQYMVIVATVIARIISGVYNFMMNKYVSFKSKGNNIKEFSRYFILFITQMSVSAILVSLLSHIFTNVTLVKIVIDFILFMISYFVQKRFIFNKKVKM